MRLTLESMPNLFLRQAEVVYLILEGGAVRGVELADGSSLGSRATVITTGTFLNGLIHIGHRRSPAGRIGEPPATRLGEFFKEAGFRVGRLKTGTPPRLDGDTIDYSCFDEQSGDPEPVFFSFRTHGTTLPQVSCHAGFQRSSSLDPRQPRTICHGGMIVGIGPRYCQASKTIERNLQTESCPFPLNPRA
jgi:tRNA uridine 5-carboxymethylaminomethyl modification enzyme